MLAVSHLLRLSLSFCQRFPAASLACLLCKGVMQGGLLIPVPCKMGEVACPVHLEEAELGFM